MTFARPWLLLLLAVPALVWWLLREPGRGRPWLTYRLELWLRAARELGLLSPRVSPLRELPAVAAALALALAAAGPRLGGAAGEAALLVLLDRSPSMAAREPGGVDRYGLALAELAGLARELPPDTEIRVLGVGGREVRRGGGLAEAAAAWLAEARAWGPAAAGRAALAEAEAGVRELGLPVVVLSDLAGPEAGFTRQGPGLEVRAVGGPVANWSLLDLELVPTWPGPEVRGEALVLAGPGPRSLVVRRREGGGEAARVEVPRASGQLRLSLAWPRAAGPVAVGLEPEDAFPWDDRLEATPPRAPALRVAVHPAEGGTALARSVAHALAAGEGRLVVEGEEPDLVVVEGGRLPAWPAGPAWLLMGTEVVGVTTGGRLSRPEVGGWDPAHPLLAGLDPSELGLDEALAAGEGGAGCRAILRAAGGEPLLLVREEPSRVVHLLFPLAGSSLGAQLLLPRFLHRLLSWYSGIDPSSPPARRPGGEPPDPEESRLEPGRSRGGPAAALLPRAGRELAPWLLLLAAACLLLWLLARREP